MELRGGNLRQWNYNDDVDEFQVIILQLVVDIDITAAVFVFGRPAVDWNFQKTKQTNK